MTINNYCLLPLAYCLFISPLESFSIPRPRADRIFRFLDALDVQERKYN